MAVKSGKSMAFFFAGAALVLIWAVSSSISTIPLGSSAHGGAGGGGALGLGSGLGGLGTGLGGLGFGGKGVGINLSISPVSIPKFNYSYEQNPPTGQKLVFLQIPIILLSIPLPSIRVGTFSLPRIGVLNQGGGGGYGGTGGTGKSSSVTKKTSVELVIPQMQILMYVIVAVLLISAILSFLKKGSTGYPKVRGETGERGTRREESSLATNRRSETSVTEVTPYEFKKSVMPYKGWGGSELISFPVPVDLPMIWKLGEPLPYQLSDGVLLEVLPSFRSEGATLLFDRPGCYALMVTKGEKRETHLIRVVESYREDVVDLVRANLSFTPSNLTVREIFRHYAQIGRLEVPAEEWFPLAVFEACRYGDLEPNREIFERFLRGMQRLKEALVVGCQSGQRADNDP
ncbi:MAG: hypothetical protein ACP5UU_05330 [Thermoprotei archaeon]